MSEWIIPLLSALGSSIVSVGASWLAFRIRFERLESATTQRVEDYRRWRVIVDDKIDRIEQEGSPQVQMLAEELNRRVERLEQRIFNGKRRP